MDRTFDIVLGTVGLVVAIGLVGVGFFFMLKKSYDPAKMLFKFVFTIPFVIFCIWFGVKIGLAGPFLIVFMAVVLSFMWTPHIGEWIASPLTNLIDGGGEPPEPKPLYSIAYSKRKLNKPLEAVLEIRRQLARFPNDYEGVMLLAGIQAEDLKDLSASEITLNHFCDRSDAPPKQVAAALTQLADWHLKLFQDADSARVVLEKIIAQFPETNLALQAAQRIAHLSGTEKQLRVAQDRQPVFVPEGVKNIGLLNSSEDLIPAETHPEKLAAEYVKHLEQHPHDTEAREKLAIIYARHYQRLDLAALELGQLIEQPEQPTKRVAHWLNLLADLQIHGGADYETVRATLGKIVERFPDLPVTEIARNRLGRLKLEFKGQQKTPDVKLGVYEQNIGLKYGSPRQL
jgi:tetratricopeptide (TPR) repeat protein